MHVIYSTGYQSLKPNRTFLLFKGYIDETNVRQAQVTSWWLAGNKALRIMNSIQGPMSL